jgi:NAD(P)H-quinone oxidoreductase subunit 6
MNALSAISATTVVFYLLAGLALFCALAVAFSRNILHSAFALMGTLAAVAGLYFSLGADFLGVVQLLVYVGGIMVLILFAVLLTRDITDIKVSNLSISMLGGVPAALLVLGMVIKTVGTGEPFKRVAVVAAPTVERIGDALLREYLLPFEIASVVLLAALVGAMVIARRAVKEEVGVSPDNPETREGDAERVSVTVKGSQVGGEAERSGLATIDQGGAR